MPRELTPLAGLADRLKRIGVTVIDWPNTRLFCERCGQHYSFAGFAGGDVTKPLPDKDKQGSKWWACPQGCNSSAPNPMTTIPFYPSAGEPGATSFVDVLKR